MNDSYEGIPMMTRFICIIQAFRTLNNNLTTVLHEMHRVVLCCINQALGARQQLLPLLSHQSLIVFINTLDLLARI